jgi:hypothetical protein
MFAYLGGNAAENEIVPEVASPNWAKDDFNDFSTHHHSQM